MYRERYPDEGGRAKRVAVLVGLLAVGILGVAVVKRLSSDAVAVLVGVAAGVGASIPTALLLMAVTRRRDDESEREHYYEDRRQAAPPVIVVAPGSVPQMMGQYPGAYPQQLPPVSGQRQFRVMGYDDEEPEPVEGERRSRAWYE
jgi:hypothetical protein